MGGGGAAFWVPVGGGINSTPGARGVRGKLGVVVAKASTRAIDPRTSARDLFKVEREDNTRAARRALKSSDFVDISTTRGQSAGG